MKFSDIKEEQWIELQPYLDTCLLPVSGLTGLEEPAEVVHRLAELRDLMDLVEIPFAGRIVTYPAIQYIHEPFMFISAIEQISKNIKKGGFKYVILITADSEVSKLEFDADLLITPDHTISESSSITEAIQDLWNS